MDPEQLAARAAALLGSGVAASDDGHPAEAAHDLRAGLRLVERSAWSDLPDLRELRGRLLVSLAWAESECGRVDAGFRLLDRAEPLLASRHRAILRAQRGLMLSRAGRDEPALVEYDAAVAALDEQGHPLDLVKALNNRSLVHLDAGRVAAARADLRRCAQIAAHNDLRLHAALSAVNLGCLDVLAGDLPAALGAFAQARSTYQLLAPGRLPSLAVERARALSAAGLFTDADRELAYAVEHADDQQLSYTHADALLARAEAALLAGRLAEAAAWAGQARVRFRGRRNARRAGLAALLELRAARPDGPAAVRALGVRARALAARLDRLGLAEDARVARLVAARAMVRSGRPAPAARAVEAVVPGRLDRLDTRLLWRLTRAEVAAAAGRPDRAARERAAGMAALRRYRSRFGSLDLQTGASAHGQDLARAGLEAALAAGSPSAVFRWAEQARAQALLVTPVRSPRDSRTAALLAELRQVRHALRTAELAGRSAPGLAGRALALERAMREESWSVPGHDGRNGPEGLGRVASVGAVRAVLDGSALVSYLRDGASLRALVLTEQSLRLVDLGGYDAAAAAVTRLRADLDTQAGRVLPARITTALDAATRHDAAVLAAAVLDPVEPLVGDRGLVVVPTGALFTAPWGALAAGRDRPITVTPSATTWQAGRHRGPAGHGTPRPRRALLVAGPGTQRGVAEVTDIARVHAEPSVLTGAAATAAATLAGLGAVDLAHIAAHGQHRSENALFSSLDLVDGPLFGYDLEQVATPPLVVLSCCDLGRSDIRPGDETLGLAAALLSSGTTTVVASVARVADELARQVMTGFHARIAAGLDPASSLAQAAYVGQPANGFICFGAS